MPQVAGFVLGAFGWAPAAGLAIGAAASPFAAAWVMGSGFAATTIGALTVKLLTSVAISALQQALEPSQQGGGITISATLRGEDNPETTILGRYATAGQWVYVNSHGSSNKYLTHVVELCSLPGATLQRLMLGDAWVTLGTTPDPDYGFPVEGGDYGGKVWIKYYDGSQTTADPLLVSQYGSDPDMPWATTAIGAGLCYAILTFTYGSEMTSVPRYLFEIDGPPLYDMRKDSTAGGVGSQRANLPQTWAKTDNPIVQAWNLLRGIPLSGGEIYGGGFSPSQMPVDVWIAAMNRCDVPLAVSGGGTEATYRAGLEVALTSAPAQAVTELLKACSGSICDDGWAWNVLVGAPSLPVKSFTDDDIIVSRSQEYDPFPSLAETYNAITCQFPDPANLYETKEAPRITNAAWEASDAYGRRMASVQLPAVPYKRQVQRLARAWIRDERRFARHIISLPPDAAAVSLIDTLDWSSARNGYSGKDFSIYEISEDILTGIRKFSLRERNPADYDWSADMELPTPAAPGRTPIAPMPISGWAVNATTLTDAAGNGRRAAILISWNPELIARGINWEVRRSGTTTVIQRGSSLDIESGLTIIAAGVLPATAYQVRARLSANRSTSWTAWTYVMTPDVRLGADDMTSGFLSEISATAELAGVKPVAALPATGDKVNQIVCLIPPGRLYRWTGTAWTSNLFAGVEAGSLDIAAFAASIRPPELFATLPTTGNSDGRTVYRTSDNTMWQRRAGAWVNVNSAELIVGQLIAGQIAAGAVGVDQLAAGAVVASKMAIGDTSNIFPDPLLVDFPNGWFWTTSADYNAAVATVAANSLEFSASANQIVMPVGGVASTGGPNSPPFSVEAGTDYFCSLCMGAVNSNGLSSNCTQRLYVRWYTETNGTGIISSSLIGDTTQTYSTSTAPLFGIVRAPANARSARLFVQRVGDAATDGMAFSGPVIRRANAGELTVDGSIRARHLAVETLLTDSAQIAAAIINAAHIVNASMTTAKIANLAVTTAKIAALAVDTAQLANAAITNAKIENLAVTGAKIADLTVGTIKITDDAITNIVSANRVATSGSAAGTRTRNFTISCLAGSKVAIFIRADFDAKSSAGPASALKWNGTVIPSQQPEYVPYISAYTSGGENPIYSEKYEYNTFFTVTAIAGTNTLTIENSTSTAGPWSGRTGPVIMIEGKK